MVDEGPGRRENQLDIERARRNENPIIHKSFTCVHTFDITSKGDVEGEGARICDCMYCQFMFAEMLKISL